MSLTILEMLRSTDYNLQHNGLIGVETAKEQLHRAIELLDKDHGLYEEVDGSLLGCVSYNKGAECLYQRVVRLTSRGKEALTCNETCMFRIKSE